jgi:hypothetical protein
MLSLFGLYILCLPSDPKANSDSYHRTQRLVFVVKEDCFLRGRNFIFISNIVKLHPLYPGERPGIHYIECWVGPNVSLEGCGKSRPHRDSIHGPSSP